MLFLYPDIDNDLLSQIPHGGILATITRLAMIVVVLATAPLLIVPCSEIIEGKMISTTTSSQQCQDHHNEINGALQQQQRHQVVSLRTRIVTRAGLCLFTVGIAVVLPGFVAVLSFVGCFSVALVSFGVPPFLHWVLLHHQTYGDNRNTESGGVQGGTQAYPLMASVMDLILFLSGIAITAVTTLFTFRKLLMVEETDPSKQE